MSTPADPFRRSSKVSRSPVRDGENGAENVFSPMQPRLPLPKDRMSFRRAMENSCMEKQHNSMAPSPEKKDPFDESVTRTREEQVLYLAWKESEAKNAALMEQLKQLQKRLEALEAKSPVQTVYETDEEQLARDTDWILKKQKKQKSATSEAVVQTPQLSKKRKASHTPELSPTKGAKNTSKQLVTAEKKLPTPPPIFVERVSSVSELNTKLKELNFKGKMSSLSSKTSFKINCTNSDEYRKLTEWLNSKNHEWHSFQDKHSRPLKVMARGIHCQTPCKDIVDELRDKGFKIHSAVNILSNKSKEPLNLFMLSFDNEQDIKLVYSIKTIGYQTVKIEELRKTSNRIVQCKNCQEFNHVRTYCHKKPKCVKCAGNHNSNECNKPSTSLKKCANCDGPHTANYRGCIVAKELQKRRDQSVVKKKGSDQISKPARTFTSQLANPKVSFAQALSGGPNTKQPVKETATTASSNKEKKPTNSKQDQNLQTVLERIEQRLQQQEEFNKMVFLNLKHLITKSHT